MRFPSLLIETAVPNSPTKSSFGDFATSVVDGVQVPPSTLRNTDAELEETNPEVVRDPPTRTLPDLEAATAVNPVLPSSRC